MNLGGMLSLYGAVLATFLALAQLVIWWSRRVRLEVKVGIERRALDPSERESSRGTPMQVSRGGEEHWEEVLVAVEVRNKGGTPVQIVGVLIEFVEDGKLSTFQIVPDPLPSVVQPGTRVECSIQKEFLDFAPAITFFGVIDALGRRFGPTRAESISAIGAAWQLPTRVGRYRKRGEEHGKEVSAFQMRDRAQMSTPRPAGRRDLPIVVKRGVGE